MPKQYSRTSFNVDTEGNMKLEMKTLYEFLIGPFSTKRFYTVFRTFEVFFFCFCFLAPRNWGESKTFLYGQSLKNASNNAENHTETLTMQAKL